METEEKGIPVSYLIDGVPDRGEVGTIGRAVNGIVAGITREDDFSVALDDDRLGKVGSGAHIGRDKPVKTEGCVQNTGCRT